MVSHHFFYLSFIQYQHRYFKINVVSRDAANAFRTKVKGVTASYGQLNRQAYHDISRLIFKLYIGFEKIISTS